MLDVARIKAGIAAVNRSRTAPWEDAILNDMAAVVAEVERQRAALASVDAELQALDAALYSGNKSEAARRLDAARAAIREVMR